jgi:Tol biopolymer transport system component
LITRGSIPVGFPDPSPGGQWLAYHSTGKKQDLFVVRTDGTALRQLTDDAFRDFWPRWSPDGKRIAFTSNRTGSSEIWSIAQDGGGLQQLSRTPGAHYPVWSPDGELLAFSVHRPRNDTMVIRVAGAGAEQPAQAIAPLSDPTITFEAWSWSPDGKVLAGTKHLADGSHVGVGIYNRDSRQYEWLTDFGEWPVWLADGRRLLFTNQGRIFVVDSRTRRHREVMFVAEGDIGGATLSRDNRTMYFTHVATEADVWLMTLDGQPASRAAR